MIKGYTEEEIFKGVVDKTENNSTTSLQFKKDVITYFSEGYDDCIAVEVGTNNGQTTRIMSYLFDVVHTINNNNSDFARELNSDRDNITFHNFNAYTTFPWPIQFADVALVDAVHTYDAVKSDVYNIMRMSSNDKKHFIFDDYSMEPVRNAINDMISSGMLKEVAFIGHKAGWSFAPTKTLSHYEGVICCEC